MITLTVARDYFDHFFAEAYGNSKLVPRWGCCMNQDSAGISTIYTCLVWTDIIQRPQPGTSLMVVHGESISGNGFAGGCMKWNHLHSLHKDLVM